MSTIKKIQGHVTRVVTTFPFEKYIEPVNRYTIYVLAIFLWGPHGAKECIPMCTGPNHVVPMAWAFLAPGWTMDMSLHGWIMQLIFSPPVFLLLYLLYRFSKLTYGKFLSLYIVRWTIMWYGVLAYFSFFFWYGSLRATMFPLFNF